MLKSKNQKPQAYLSLGNNSNVKRLHGNLTQTGHNHLLPFLRLLLLGQTVIGLFHGMTVAECFPCPAVVFVML